MIAQTVIQKKALQSQRFSAKVCEVGNVFFIDIFCMLRVRRNNILYYIYGMIDII